MVEFNLGQDWTEIKGVSYKVFAARIDEMGRKLEFSRLREIKRSKLKLSSIEYNKFEPQEYLNMKNISLDQVLAIFSFRTRMVPCDGNFKTGHTIKPCPWCEDHPDTQDSFFKCGHLGKLKINGSYQETFGDQISSVLAMTHMDVQVGEQSL